MSLSTNIFTTLCFEPSTYATHWQKFASSFFFIFTSSMCLVVSVKVVNIQNYFISKKISDNDEKQDIIKDITKSTRLEWWGYFILIFFFFTAAICMLGVPASKPTLY